jgi:hypothetical protein
LLPWIMYANNLQTEAVDKGLDNTRLEAFLEHIQPCSIGGTLANCSEVCQNSTYLFDPLYPANIVTCGSWASTCSMAMAVSDFSLFPPTLFAAFEQVGLGLANDTWRDVAVVRENVMDCFTDFCVGARCSTADGLHTACPCTNQQLFLGNRSTPAPHLFELCGPRTVDLDIGGIGVGKSYLAMLEKLVALMLL